MEPDHKLMNSVNSLFFVLLLLASCGYLGKEKAPSNKNKADEAQTTDASVRPATTNGSPSKTQIQTNTGSSSEESITTIIAKPGDDFSTCNEHRSKFEDFASPIASSPVVTSPIKDKTTFLYQLLTTIQQSTMSNSPVNSDFVLGLKKAFDLIVAATQFNSGYTNIATPEKLNFEFKSSEWTTVKQNSIPIAAMPKHVLFIGDVEVSVSDKDTNLSVPRFILASGNITLKNPKPVIAGHSALMNPIIQNCFIVASGSIDLRDVNLRACVVLSGAKVTGNAVFSHVRMIAEKSISGYYANASTYGGVPVDYIFNFFAAPSLEIQNDSDVAPSASDKFFTHFITYPEPLSVAGSGGFMPMSARGTGWREVSNSFWDIYSPINLTKQFSNRVCLRTDSYRNTEDVTICQTILEGKATFSFDAKFKDNSKIEFDEKIGKLYRYDAQGKLYSVADYAESKTLRDDMNNKFYLQLAAGFDDEVGRYLSRHHDSAYIALRKKVLHVVLSPCEKSMSQEHSKIRFGCLAADPAVSIDVRNFKDFVTARQLWRFAERYGLAPQCYGLNNTAIAFFENGNLKNTETFEYYNERGWEDKPFAKELLDYIRPLYAAAKEIKPLISDERMMELSLDRVFLLDRFKYINNLVGSQLLDKRPVIVASVEDKAMRFDIDGYPVSQLSPFFWGLRGDSFYGLNGDGRSNIAIAPEHGKFFARELQKVGAVDQLFVQHVDALVEQLLRP